MSPEEGVRLMEEGSREIGEGNPYRVNRGRRVRICEWFEELLEAGLAVEWRWARRVARSTFPNR